MNPQSKPDYSLWPNHWPKPSFEQICSEVLRAMGIPSQPLGSVIVKSTMQHRRPADLAFASVVIARLASTIRGMSSPEVARALGMKSHGYLTEKRNWSVRFMASEEGINMHNRLMVSVARSCGIDGAPIIRGDQAGKFNATLTNHAGGAV
jgi:hypothetical protein